MHTGVFSMLAILSAFFGFPLILIEFVHSIPRKIWRVPMLVIFSAHLSPCAHGELTLAPHMTINS